MRRTYWMPALLLLVSSVVWSQAPQKAEPAGSTGSPAATDSGATPPAAAPGDAGSSASGASSGAVTTPTPGANIDSATYIIGAQDGLQINVWKDPSFSGTFPVRPDGMISLAMIGDVPAAGLTPMQLAANLTEKLKKYIQDPIVSVVVTAVNSKLIYLVGEVGKVGPIMMTPGMTALQAIATAGGLSTFAHPKNITILRGKEQQKIPFDYKKALKGDPKAQITLQPGDTIVVP
jgi:polysaccharide biosynthesis/export protein